ncbi:MAG: response regulator transcription factor [Proteobacteria bacterium]|nr:response regulator transcription factor [Pseudomonadota bacterium]MBS0328972.1 response regulator transcription factor [Pseudomonadota bacterium]
MNPDHTLIIADDNSRDRSFIIEVLAPRQLIPAENGAEALSLCTGLEQPWVITDIQMPRINGIELARRVWETKPSARFLFWSQYDDEMYVRALAKTVPAETVYGYIMKNNSVKILEKAVNAVFDECQCWIDPQVRPVQARAHKHTSSISDLEFEVLIDLALGLTDNAIAERHYLSRRGVQNRLQSLYIKLGANTEGHTLSDSELINVRMRAVALALQRGLINAFELQKEEEKLAAWIKSRTINQG